MSRGNLKVLDTVALMEDVPSHSLPRGQMGTVLEELGGDTFEVEFLDENGVSIAIIPLPANLLMALHIARPKAS